MWSETTFGHKFFKPSFKNFAWQFNYIVGLGAPIFVELHTFGVCKVKD